MLLVQTCPIHLLAILLFSQVLLFAALQRIMIMITSFPWLAMITLSSLTTISSAKNDVKCQATVPIGSGQSCRTIAKANGIHLNAFMACNPHINCRSLEPGSPVCLNCQNPNQRLLDCNKLYSSKASDSCDSIAASHEISVPELVDCNPGMIKCPRIGFGSNLCLKCPKKLTAGVPDAGDVCDCGTERGKWILQKFLVCNYVNTAPPFICQWISTQNNGNGNNSVTTSTSTTTTSFTSTQPTVEPTIQPTTMPTVEPTITVLPTPPPPPPLPTTITTTTTSDPQPTSKIGFVFSPYKDISWNLDWNTFVISSMVTGSKRSIYESRPQGMNALTLAFATGECGAENWGGIEPDQWIPANIGRFQESGIDYILSTGGANGIFSCATPEKFIAFVERYYSNRLIGIDHDIEAGQTAPVLQALIDGSRAAERRWPNLRISFTIATLAGNEGTILNPTGNLLMDLLRKSGWNSYIVNLMTMNYGTEVRSGICIAGSDGRCDMGLSAVNAARRLSRDYNIPYDRIEVTPMIGNNDVTPNVFYMKDIKPITDFAKQVGLAGVHHWSFDRDVNGPAPWSDGGHNSMGTAGPGPFGYTIGFMSELSNGVIPPPPPPPPQPPTVTTTSSEITTSTTITDGVRPTPDVGVLCDCNRERGRWILEKGLVCNYVSSVPPFTCQWIKT